MSSTLVPSTSRGVNIVPTFDPDIIFLYEKYIIDCKYFLAFFFKAVENYNVIYVKLKITVPSLVSYLMVLYFIPLQMTTLHPFFKA